MKTTKISQKTQVRIKHPYPYIHISRLHLYYIYIYTVYTHTIYQQKDAVTLWSPPTQHKLPPRTTGLVGEGQVGVFSQSVGTAGLKPHTDSNVSLVMPCLRRTMTNLFYGVLRISLIICGGEKKTSSSPVPVEIAIEAASKTHVVHRLFRNSLHGSGGSISDRLGLGLFGPGWMSNGGNWAVKLLIWPIFQADFRRLTSVKNALLRSMSGPQMTVSLGMLYLSVFSSFKAKTYPRKSTLQYGQLNQSLSWVLKMKNCWRVKQSVRMAMGPIDIKLASANLRDI